MNAELGDHTLRDRILQSVWGFRDAKPRCQRISSAAVNDNAVRDWPRGRRHIRDRRHVSRKAD